MNDSTRLNNALTSVINKTMHRVDFHAFYLGTVLSDHGDFHVDVEPDTDRLPPFTRIPIMRPWPGVGALKLQVGARVLITFEGGNPERPYVAQFQAGTLEHLAFTTGQGLTFELNDDRDNEYATPFIEVTDATNKVRMQPKQGLLHVTAKDDLTITVEEGDANINANGNINLGGADGKAVARVGDSVVGGEIVSGSSKVKAT